MYFFDIQLYTLLSLAASSAVALVMMLLGSRVVGTVVMVSTLFLLVFSQFILAAVAH